MALVPRRAGVTAETVSAIHANQIPASVGTGLRAGEALDPAAPCYIAANGLVFMTNATALDAAAAVDGFTGKPYTINEPVTLLGRGVIFEYTTGGLTPGARLYAAATAGRLDDAPTVGDPAGGGVAKAVTATHIRVIRDA
jgi:hypothetical protein